MAFPTGTIDDEEKLFPPLQNSDISPIRPLDDIWGKDGDAFFYNGTAKMSCPTGLVWNSAMRSCSWPLEPVKPKRAFGDYVEEAYELYKKERDGGNSVEDAIQTLRFQYTGVGQKSRIILEDIYLASKPPVPTPKPPIVEHRNIYMKTV